MGIKERDNVFLLDVPILPSCLFRDTVNTVVDRFISGAHKTFEAFRDLIPHRVQEPAPSTSRSWPGPSYKRHPPPPQRQGTGKHAQTQPSRGRQVLRSEIRNNPNCRGPWPPKVTPNEGGLCTPQHCVPDLPWGPCKASPLTLPLAVI